MKVAGKSIGVNFVSISSISFILLSNKNTRIAVAIFEYEYRAKSIGKSRPQTKAPSNTILALKLASVIQEQRINIHNIYQIHGRMSTRIVLNNNNLWVVGN